MASELARRLAFTLGALLIYRLGCNIPLPGINDEFLDQVFRPNASGMSSNSIQTMAIFALGILPYISAAVFLQVAGIVSRRLRALQMEGDRGRQTTRRITLALTIGLSAFQAYGIAGALEGMGSRIVENPGWPFLISTTLTLTGGTIFLAWLSEQITAFGIGNGIALILLASSATAIRDPIAVIVSLGQRSLLPSKGVLSSLVVIVLVTGLVVIVERARRNFQIDYPKRQIGDSVFESLSSILPVKLNPAGIIPVILASWILSILILFIGILAAFNPHWLDLVTTQLAAGRPAYYVLYGLLIFLCTLFYAAYLFGPEDIAERLQKQGAEIRSITPGDATVTHLDYALSRTVLIGAAYLTIICLLPEVLLRYTQMPAYFGGLSLLVLVCTVIDFEDQIRGYLGFSRRARVDPSAP
jgi:preprotein translocase subunit SecY